MVLIKRYKNGKSFDPVTPKKVEIDKTSTPPKPLRVDRAAPAKRNINVASSPAPKKRGCGCGRKK